VWPHSITVGLRGKAIVIGTDALEMVLSLDPWRIDDVGDPTDYCLELNPEAPDSGRPRPLPGLYHGSTALLRSRDTERLTMTLFRILASHAHPAGPGQVRVALMPVIRDGVALLVPRDSASAVPDRWLLGQGIDAIYTSSSLVDAQKGSVIVDPPLGSNEEPRSLEFGGWWLSRQHWDGDLSPGFAVAEVMTLVTDVNPDNAASTLRTVAALVERSQPVFAPTAEAVRDALTSSLRRVSSG
jgi:hypothetical protein